MAIIYFIQLKPSLISFGLISLFKLSYLKGHQLPILTRNPLCSSTDWHTVAKHTVAHEAPACEREGDLCRCAHCSCKKGRHTNARERYVEVKCSRASNIRATLAYESTYYSSI